MPKYNLEKRILGRTGLSVTFLGFGALEIGRDWGLGDETARRRPSDEAAARVLNGVLDLGINLIDTARAYHRSEERIGQALSHRRAEFVLSSKCGEHSAEPGTYYDFSYAAVRQSIETSLRLLRTDCIDILHIHFGGPEEDQVLSRGETVRAMKEAQAEGKVRFLAASPPLHLLDACIESGDFDVLQVDYSLLNRQAEPLIRKAASRGIGILVRGGFAMGRLTPKGVAEMGRDPRLAAQIRPLLDLVDGDASLLPQLALAFLRSNPAVSSVLVGSKDLAHVERNIRLLNAQMEPELVERAMRLTGGVLPAA